MSADDLVRSLLAHPRFAAARAQKHQSPALAELIHYAARTANHTRTSAGELSCLYGFRLQQALGTPWILKKFPLANTQVADPYKSITHLARVVAGLDPGGGLALWCPKLWEVFSTDTKNINIRYIRDLLEAFLWEMVRLLFPHAQRRPAHTLAAVNRPEFMRYAIGATHIPLLAALLPESAAVRMELAARMSLQFAESTDEPVVWYTLFLPAKSAEEFVQRLLLYNVLNFVRAWALHFSLHGSGARIARPVAPPLGRLTIERDSIFFFRASGLTLCGKGVQAKLTLAWDTLDCDGIRNLRSCAQSALPSLRITDDDAAEAAIIAMYAVWLGPPQPAAAESRGTALEFYNADRFRKVFTRQALRAVVAGAAKSEHERAVAAALLRAGEFGASDSTTALSIHVARSFPSGLPAAGYPPDASTVQAAEYLPVSRTLPPSDEDQINQLGRLYPWSLALTPAPATCVLFSAGSAPL
jgi:hypothetical protein